MSIIDLTAKVREFKELQIFIKQMEEEAEAAKAVITAEMAARQTDTLNVDVFTVKYTAYLSSRVDTTALKKDLPDVAARYKTLWPQSPQPGLSASPPPFSLTRR